MQQQKSVYKTNVICAEQIVVVRTNTVCNGGSRIEIQHKKPPKSNNLYVTEIYASLDGAAPP